MSISRHAASCLFCVMLMLGCVPLYLVAPRDGRDLAQTTAAGVTMTVHLSRWSGSPPDLDDYVTPVAIDIANASTADVQVSYADFALTDRHGNRYPALHPFLQRQGAAPTEDGVKLAYRGPPRLHGWARTVPPAWHGGGHGWHGWPGVHLAPAVRFYFGASVLYWSAPFWYPSDYWTYVNPWTPPYAVWAPTPDVMDLALPEAVLRPGGRLSGFLYFRRATGGGIGPMALSWAVREANTHAVLSELQLPLAVVRH